MNKKPPTVFKDCRGEIRKIKFHGVEVNLVFTKAGALRGGDEHPTQQNDLVLQGKVAIHERLNSVAMGWKTFRHEVVQGQDAWTIGTGTPHLFESVTDSVVLEWWNGPFEAKYYRPYRKLVEKWIKEHSR